MSHHWARKIRQLGHAVVLLSPHLVRPYVRRNKTDRTDAVALVEAYRHRQIRPVPVKTPEQQLLTSLHRLRAGWVRQRTARRNTLRGLLREQGFFITVGAKHVLPAVAAFIEDADNHLAMALRGLLAEVCSEVREVERRIDMVEAQLAALARQLPAVQRLQQVPGIGLIISTSFMVRAPCSVGPPSPPAPTGSAPGSSPCAATPITTRRPWPWPTGWPVSPGPSACVRPISAPCPPLPDHFPKETEHTRPQHAARDYCRST